MADHEAVQLTLPLQPGKEPTPVTSQQGEIPQVPDSTKITVDRAPRPITLSERGDRLAILGVHALESTVATDITVTPRKPVKVRPDPSERESAWDDLGGRRR